MSNASVTEFSGSPKCLVLLPQCLWPCPELGSNGFFHLPERRRLNPDFAAMGFQLRAFSLARNVDAMGSSTCRNVVGLTLTSRLWVFNCGDAKYVIF
jgi:hypothetical protein